MPITPSLITCTPRTAALADYFGRHVPNGRDNGQLGLLQFLLGSVNTSGYRKLSDDIVGVPGKKRGVRVLAPSPVCISVCTGTFACNEVLTQTPPALEIFDIDINGEFFPCDGGGDPTELYFDGAAFKQYCELEDGRFLQDQIARFDMQFLHQLDKKVVELLTTRTAPLETQLTKTMPILKDSSTTGTRIIHDEWLMWIQEELDLYGYSLNDVVIMGGRMVRTISQKYRVATASMEGYDVTKTAGDLPDMYYDRNFDAAIGPNALILVPKGSYQFVTFQKYVGEKAYRDQKQVLFTKTAPLGNGASLTMDYKWYREPECDKYGYFPSIYAELVNAVPSGVCGGADFSTYLKIVDCGANTIPECPPVTP